MKYSVDDVLKNIMQVRGRDKIKQRQIAEILDVTEATYNRIESGKIALTYEKLTSIASFLKMSVIDLITYPDTYAKCEPSNSTKILVEVDISNDEFIKIGLKDKVANVLCK